MRATLCALLCGLSMLPATAMAQQRTGDGTSVEVGVVITLILPPTLSATTYNVNNKSALTETVKNYQKQNLRVQNDRTGNTQNIIPPQDSQGYANIFVRYAITKEECVLDTGVLTVKEGPNTPEAVEVTLLCGVYVPPANTMPPPANVIDVKPIPYKMLQKTSR